MEPRPTGSSSLMSGVAAKFAHYADRLDSLSAIPNDLLSRDAFEGPGRSEHDAAFREITSAARAAAIALRDEATTLHKDALDLARRKADWDMRNAAEHRRHLQQRRDA